MNLSPSARVSICLSVCPENCAFPLAPGDWYTGHRDAGTARLRNSRAL